MKKQFFLVMFLISFLFLYASDTGNLNNLGLKRDHLSVEPEAWTETPEGTRYWCRSNHTYVRCVYASGQDLVEEGCYADVSETCPADIFYKKDDDGHFVRVGLIKRGKGTPLAIVPNGSSQSVAFQGVIGTLVAIEKTEEGVRYIFFAPQKDDWPFYDKKGNITGYRTLANGAGWRYIYKLVNGRLVWVKTEVVKPS